MLSDSEALATEITDCNHDLGTEWIAPEILTTSYQYHTSSFGPTDPTDESNGQRAADKVFAIH